MKKSNLRVFQRRFPEEKLIINFDNFNQSQILQRMQQIGYSRIYIYLPVVKIDLTISFDGFDPLPLPHLDKEVNQNVYSVQLTYKFSMYIIQSQSDDTFYVQAKGINKFHIEKPLFHQFYQIKERGEFVLHTGAEHFQFIKMKTPVNLIKEFHQFLKYCGGKQEDQKEINLWNYVLDIVLKNENETDQKWYLDRLFIIPASPKHGFKIFELLKLREPFLNNFIEDNQLQINQILSLQTQNFSIKQWLQFIKNNFEKGKEEDSEQIINQNDLKDIFYKLKNKVGYSFEEVELIDVKNLLKEISKFRYGGECQELRKMIYDSELNNTQPSQIEKFCDIILSDFETHYEICGQDTIETFFKNNYQNPKIFEVIPKYLQLPRLKDSNFINTSYSSFRIQQIPMENRMKLLKIFSENRIPLQFNMNEFFHQLLKEKKQSKQILEILQPAIKLYTNEPWVDIIRQIFSRIVNTTEKIKFKKLFKRQKEFTNLISSTNKEDQIYKLIEEVIAERISQSEFSYIVKKVKNLNEYNNAIILGIQLKIKNEHLKDQNQFIECCREISEYTQEENNNQYLQEMEKQAEWYLIAIYDKLKKLNENFSNPFTLQIIQSFSQKYYFKENVKNDLKELIIIMKEKSISNIKSQLLEQQQIISLAEAFSLKSDLDKISEEINIFEIEEKKFNNYKERFINLFEPTQIKINKDLKYSEIEQAKSIFEKYKNNYNTYFIFSQLKIFNKLICFFEEEFSKNQVDIQISVDEIIDCSLIGMSFIISSLLKDSEFITGDQPSRQYIEKFLIPNKIVTIDIFKIFVGEDLQIQSNNIKEVFKNYRSLIQLNLSLESQIEIQRAIMGLNQIEFFIKKTDLILKLGELFFIKKSNQENQKFLQSLENLKEIQFDQLSIYQVINKYKSFYSDKKWFECQYEIQFELILKMEQIYIDINNNKDENFIDLRDFVEEDDFSTNTLLINLEKHKGLFKSLVQIRDNFKQNSYSYNKMFDKLQMIIESHIKKQDIEDLIQCIDSYYKIEKLRGSMNKKEQLGKLGCEIIKTGSFTFSLNNQKVNLQIEYEDKTEKITEQKVREIYSRVCVSNNPEIQLSDKEQQILNLKNQWNNVQKIKAYLQELVAYGQTHILSREIKFENKTQSFEKIQKKMNEYLDSLHEELNKWKSELHSNIQKYPLLSLFGYKLYQPLIELIYQKSQSDNSVVLSILSYLGIQKKEIKFIDKNQINNYENQNQSEKLQFIGDFITRKSKFKSEKVIKAESNLQTIVKKKIFYFEVQESKEVIQFIKKLHNLEEKQEYFQFFFFQSNSTIKDLELFLMRYELLNLENITQFFLIFPTSQIEASFENSAIELITILLKKDTQLLNNLYIISKEKSFLSGSSLINVSNVDEFIVSTSNNQAPFEGKVDFVYSKQPGEGKTFWIKTQISNQRYQSLRLPTYCQKKHIIGLLQSQPNYNCIHVDLYQNPTIEIDFFLFEMIYLNCISIHSNNIVFVNKDTKFYVEISNTLDNCLNESLFIKEFFGKPPKEINFSIEQFSTVFMDQEQQLNASATYEFLQYAGNFKSINTKILEIPVQFDEKNNRTKFIKVLEKYYLTKFTKECSEPCYYQVSHFINLFGSEMRKFSKSPFLIPDNLGKYEVRSDIIRMSYELILDLSINKHRKINSKISLSLAEKMENRILQVQTIDKFQKGFVTFQEQESPSITSFFTSQNQIPNSIKWLYQSNKEKLLIMDSKDSENQSEAYKSWLVHLVNQHGDKKNFTSQISVQKDNFFKIAMIFMNFRANSSQILMGESGIGKTRLIQLLSELMEAVFEIFPVHAGITEKEVKLKMDELILKAQEKPESKFIIFFDEINTSKLVGGMFKEILQDRFMMGTKLPTNIIPVGAMNPYKLKTDKMREMEKLFFNGSLKKNIHHSLNNTDLQFMVFYPTESLLKIIKNFDKLSDEDEKKYIFAIILSAKTALDCQNEFTEEQIKLFSEAVDICQKQLRIIMGSSSACSLRDVVRAAKLFFCLSLWIIYIVRLPKHEFRNQFIQLIEKKIQGLKIQNIVDKVSEYVSTQCHMSERIMKNQALNYNLLALLISIQNKIPLILIGQPGSSKTLSLQIIISSMKGKSSPNPFFQKFYAVIPLFYQGHVESTSKRILEIFENASQKQKALIEQNQDSEFVMLVCFEEVGLAEISPHNPLKTLHPILENPQHAFVSISNWPLDQSKMNRMISVYRLDSSEDELFQTIQKQMTIILENDVSPIYKNKLTQEIIEKDYFLLKNIIKIFREFLKEVANLNPQFEQFHGMRDFYGLIRTFSLHRVQALKGTLKLSFSPEDSAIYAFQRHLQGHPEVSAPLPNIIEQFFSKGISKMDNSQMIFENLNESTPNFTSRHLMVITPNVNIAIEFVKQELNKQYRPYEVISGSGFEMDKGLDSTFEVLNRIMNCVECGKTVILSNLSNVYQSIYELVNQNYRMSNGIASCQISLGSETNHVRVQPKFKLIMIIPKDQVPLRIDGPLLNRFEKHYLDPQIFEENIKDDILSLQQHFVQQNDPAKIFPFTNVEEIISNIVFTNSENQLNQIAQMLYHLSTFRAAVTQSNETNVTFFNTYVSSKLHSSYKQFMEVQFESQKNNNRPNLFFITSFQNYSKSETNDFYIDLETIKQSKVLQNKLQEFRNLLEKSDTSSNPLIFAISCSVEHTEQIQYTQEKINEWIVNYLASQDPEKTILQKYAVAMIMKVKLQFKMPSLITGWQYYHIEELFPLSTEQPSLKQINTTQLLQNKQSNIMSVINFHEIIREHCHLNDNILKSCMNFFKKVKESSDQKAIKLQQFLEIFGSQTTSKYTHFIECSIQIILVLIMKGLKNFYSVEEFLINFVFKDQKDSIGFATQISNSVKQLVESAFTTFMLILEDKNMVFSIEKSCSKTKKQETLCKILIDQLSLSKEQLAYPRTEYEDLVRCISPHIKERINKLSKNLYYPLTPNLIHHLEVLIERSFQDKIINPQILLNSLQEEFLSCKDNLFEITKDYQFIYNKSDMFMRIAEFLHENRNLGIKQYEKIPKEIDIIIICLLHKTEIEKITAFLTTLINHKLIDLNKFLSCISDKCKFDSNFLLRDFEVRIVLEISHLLFTPNELTEADSIFLNYRELLENVLRFIDEFEIKEYCYEVQTQVSLILMIIGFVELNANLNKQIAQQFDFKKVISLDLVYFKELQSQIQQLVYSSSKIEEQKQFLQEWNTFLLEMMHYVNQYQISMFNPIDLLRRSFSIIELVEKIQYDLNLASQFTTHLLPKQKIIINLAMKDIVGKIANEKSIVNFYNESVNIKLISYTNRESASLLILSQTIQAQIIAPSFKNEEKEGFIDFFIQHLYSFSRTHPIQQAILLAIMRETVKYSIQPCNTGNLALKELFEQIISKTKPFVQFVFKIINHTISNGNVSEVIKNSFYLKDCKELTNIASKSDSLFLLNQFELNLYNRYYQKESQSISKLPSFTEVIKEILNQSRVPDAPGFFSSLKSYFIYEDSRINSFVEIFRSRLNENNFYPFMMLNNIPMLLKFNDNRNSYLYKCSKCQEFTFSDKGLQLETYGQKCKRCSTMVYQDNIVMKYVNQNHQELEKQRNDQQWTGFYLNIISPYFRLDQGEPLHFNICTLFYFCSIYFARQNKPYNELTLMRNKKLNEYLKISQRANAEVFLVEQIKLAMTYIEQDLNKKSFTNQEQFIILIKIANQIITDCSIVSTSKKDDRIAINQIICQKIDLILANNQKEFQEKNKIVSILKELEEIKDASEIKEGFMRTLRNTTFDLSPDYIKDMWLRQFPNNKFLCLKYIFQLQKLEFVSEVLPNLISFAQMVTSNLAQQINYKDAEELTLLELLKNDKDNFIYQFYIQKLIPTWNRIREVEKDYQIGSETKKIPILSELTNVRDLVFGSEKNDQQVSVFNKVLELICSIQNNIILTMENQSQSESSEQEPIQKLVKSIFHDSLTCEIKKKLLSEVNPSFNILRNYDKEIFTHFAMNDVEYQKGTQIIDDIMSFQEKLIRQIFLGTVIIDLENSPRYNFLQNPLEIGYFSEFSIPQVGLSDDQQQKFSNISEFEIVYEILIHLSTLFYIFKNDSQLGDSSISKKMLEIRIKSSYSTSFYFPETLMLKHLISIIRLLEFNWMDQLVENCHPNFMQPIDKELFSKSMELIQNKGIDIDNFRIALGRFIIRTLCQVTSLDSNGFLFKALFNFEISQEFWNDATMLEKEYENFKSNKITYGQSYQLFCSTKKYLLGI